MEAMLLSMITKHTLLSSVKSGRVPLLVDTFRDTVWYSSKEMNMKNGSSAGHNPAVTALFVRVSLDSGYFSVRQSTAAEQKDNNFMRKKDSQGQNMALT